jgi:protein-L-isoaspartate O-methyltransferase
MHDQTLKHYDQHEEAFTAQYQAAEPEALHKILMRWLPSSGAVLEVGGGSGRDAVFMAGLGLDVVATDGSAGMVDQARLQVSTLSAETAVIIKGSCVLNIKASIKYNQPHVDECVQPYQICSCGNTNGRQMR